MITLRVKEPAQAVRFYRDVVGLEARLLSPELAHVILPGGMLALVRDRNVELLHGAGAGRHRPGVGVEIHVPVADAAEVARRIRTGGGFLVREVPGAVTARDLDGYVLTFESGV